MKIKRVLFFLTAPLALLLCAGACTPQEQPELPTEPPTTEIVTSEEVKKPDPLPYLIPYPDRIDLTTLDAAVFKAAFTRGSATVISQGERGLEAMAKNESRDPGITWDVDSMYEAAGYPVNEQSGNYVPFTPEEKKVIVFKIQAEWGGAFEMFYATNEREHAKGKYAMTEIYGGDSEFFGERVSQYVIFEANESTEDWCVRFNNGFRLDYSNCVNKGNVFIIEQVAFCKDRAEAEAYIAEDRGEIPPVPEVAAGYYVCLYENRLHLPKDNVKGERFDTLDEAKAYCDQYMKYGYRVSNEKGEVEPTFLKQYIAHYRRISEN